MPVAFHQGVLIGQKLAAFLLAVLLWLSPAIAWIALAQGAPVRPHYSLTATLDFPQGRLQVREVVHYPNRTKDFLPHLVFQVTPAYFNAFKLLRASASGRQVFPTQKDTVLTVPLTELLPPGQSAVIELEFELVMPRPGSGRFGMGENMIALGNWFPIASIYRGPRLAAIGQPQGWDAHTYVDMGDPFTTEMADFSVELISSTPLTVAHTGQLVSRTENRWVFQAKEVRDFALAVSDRYERLTRVYEGVEVTAFFLPEHSKAGAEYVQAAGEMLAWMNRTVGPYPYPTLVLAEAPSLNLTAMGQEYPSLIFVTTAVAGLGEGPGSYLGYLVHHEVAHQWFYGLVGNDQVYEPWVDEATVTWLSMHFLRENYPEKFVPAWQQRMGVAPGVTPRFGRSTPVNISIYDYADEGIYYPVVYRNGAAFLEEAYRMVGKDAMTTFLRQFVRTFQGDIATGTAYLDMLQATSSVNLYPLIAKYFSYPRYAFKEPPLMEVKWPSEPWMGSASVAISSPGSLTDVKAYADDAAIPVNWTSNEVAISTAALSPGSHLFTLQLTDMEGRTIEFPARVTVAPPPPPEPTPTLVLRQPDKTMETVVAVPEAAPKKEPVFSTETTFGWMLLAGALLATIGVWSVLSFPPSTAEKPSSDH